MTVRASLIPTCKQDGFTYLSVVILVTIIGLAGAATLRLGSTLQRVAAENALIDIGGEFSDALHSYAAATPPGQPTYPPSMKELLRDPRFPQLRRHLRRIYVDPMTGKAEWGIIKVTDKGGIAGIYSLSNAQPIKVGNFPARFVAFEGKSRISDWKFTAEGGQTGGVGTKPGAPNQGLPPPGDGKGQMIPGDGKVLPNPAEGKSPMVPPVLAPPTPKETDVPVEPPSEPAPALEPPTEPVEPVEPAQPTE